MRIALITGASSGLGRTFALQIDRTEKHIDEIWLVARRRERLKEVAAMLDTPAKILAMDVTEEESIRQLELLLAGNGDAQNDGNDSEGTANEATDAFRKEPVRVGMFVNCAGYAKIGNYAKVSRFDSANMIDLNC